MKAVDMNLVSAAALALAVTAASSSHRCGHDEPPTNPVPRFLQAPFWTWQPQSVGLDHQCRLAGGAARWSFLLADPGQLVSCQAARESFRLMSRLLGCSLSGPRKLWISVCWGAKGTGLSVASLISVFSGSVRSSFREGRSSVCGLAWRICGGNNSARHVCCVPPGTPLEG